MNRTAVLLDGGYVRKRLRKLLKRYPTASDVNQLARQCLKQDESLFRIYYYDSPPYPSELKNPISGESVTKNAQKGIKFHDQMRISERVAYRGGELIYVGWVVSEDALKELIKEQRSIEAKDLKPNLKQKGVDMKIGLDIAWLSSKSIVDRLVLVTADSDFVPAMKFARREGVQVVVATLGHGLRQELKEHADEVRTVDFKPSSE